MTVSPDNERSTPMDSSLPPNDRFLRLADLVGLTGMGKTWITDRVRRGEFPRPIKMGHSAVWQESAVRAWMAEQIARSQRACSPSVR